RAMESVEQQIESLDLRLFDHVESQSSPGDRRAWLGVQRAMRREGPYVYLEIGSHLGGSIQQHLVDPRCVAIVSIDKRPPVQPDDRGADVAYESNSTARMLENLRRVAPQALSKLTTFDADARDIDPDRLPARANFCFIDGE